MNRTPSVENWPISRPCGAPGCHDQVMNSRVHPNYKTQYRVTNWAEYDRALVRRGDLTLWISEDAIAAWKSRPTGRRGAQQKFSDDAIETALTLRQVFKLPLRQAEGFLKSILSLMSVDLEAPDHTTLSPRGQRLDIKLDVAVAGVPIHLVVDSSGLSIIGEGEWGCRKARGARQTWLEEAAPRRRRERCYRRASADRRSYRRCEDRPPLDRGHRR